MALQPGSHDDGLNIYETEGMPNLSQAIAALEESKRWVEVLQSAYEILALFGGQSAHKMAKAGSTENVREIFTKIDFAIAQIKLAQNQSRIE